MNLLKNAKIDHVLALIASSASTDSSSSAIDMAGYEGVLLVTPVTTATTGSVVTLNGQGCATSGGSYATLTGATATLTSPANGTLLVVDIKHPTTRYIKANITSATQAATFGVTMAIRYGAKKAPVVQETTGAFTVVASV